MILTPANYSSYYAPSQRMPLYSSVPQGYNTVPFTQKLPPVNQLLADPITRKTYGLSNKYDDKLLRLTRGQEFKLGLEKAFVTLPKTIMQGLQGDPRFTFSDYLDITKIPYYVGGAVLAVTFAAGKDPVGFSRQTVGVGLYYLGMIAAQKAIDGFYKLKTGVDLNLRFQKANGDIEKVFASTNFPRFDLLKEEDYEKLAEKLQVPQDVADQKREVQDRVKEIISASRTDKLLLGNTLAVLGAGYIARTDTWIHLVKDWGSLKRIWDLNKAAEGSVPNRLQETFKVILAKCQLAGAEAFSKANRPLRYGVFAGVAAVVGSIFAHSWLVSKPEKKRYQSPFISNLSPALSPEQSPYTAALQQNLPGGKVDKLDRTDVFQVAQQLEQLINIDNDLGSHAVPNNASLGALPPAFPPYSPYVMPSSLNYSPTPVSRSQVL